jgi:hypothetical protein
MKGKIFHLWETDLKDKHIHKCRYNHIYIQNMFPIVGLFEETRGRKERKR